MPKTTLVAITITLLAVLEFFLFSFPVGKARGQYGIKAPAVTGHPVFERYHRVHMNTLEQLMVFLPLLWIAGGLKLVAWYWLALLGALFLVGRLVYLRSYVADPEKRSAGFAMGGLAVLALFLIDIIGVILLWVHQGSGI
jgi:glutathione S-transferase